jgi:predicted nucleic acid-binding protein
VARVFIDTSAIYALIDRTDSHHKAARSGLDRLRKLRVEPVITNFIVAEGHALLLARLGPETARGWLAGIVWHIERVTVEDEAAAHEILFGQTDKTYSYTDAVSFAVMKRLHIGRAMAFDRHFKQFGFEVV